MTEKSAQGQGENPLSEAILGLIKTVDWRYKRALPPALVEKANSGLTKILSDLEASGRLDSVSGIDFDQDGQFLEVKFKHVLKQHPTSQDFDLHFSDPAPESIFLTLGRKE